MLLLDDGNLSDGHIEISSVFGEGEVGITADRI